MSKTHLVMPEHYAAKEDGSIVSLPREQVINNRWGTTTVRKLKGRVLKQFLSGSGYLKVSCGEGFRKDVHRLIAETFLPNPDNLPCVNHIDGDKLNNKVDNLEWVSYSGNMKHASSRGTVRGFYGDQKLVPSEDTDNLILKEYERVGSTGKMNGFMGCHASTLRRYIRTRKLPVKRKVNQYG